jgi:hypothetical protein
MLRQRTFCTAIEQAFVGELLLQAQEPLVERPEPGLAHRLHRELESPARLIERNERAHFDLRAVGRLPVERAEAAFEHHAIDLGAVVLEREVAVSGGCARQVGDLALHPHEGESPFQRIAHVAQQLRDGDRGCRARDGTAGKFVLHRVLHRWGRAQRAYTNPHPARLPAGRRARCARTPILSAKRMKVLRKTLLKF